MRHRYITLVVVVLLFSCFSSCKKSSTTVTEPNNGGNLISNPSFEFNGQPSLAGWKSNDTSAILFSTDVPPGGGSWSITIETVWAPPLRVQTTVPAFEGNHRYRLSTWAKAKGVGGKIHFIFNKAIRGTVTISDSTWKLYTIIDSLTTVSGESLVVELSGGFSQLLAGTTHYDLCKLEKLD